MFQKAPLVQNSSPFAGYQFFGEVEIDAQSRALTVTLRDLDGEPVFSQELQPDGAWSRGDPIPIKEYPDAPLA